MRCSASFSTPCADQHERPPCNEPLPGDTPQFRCRCSGDSRPLLAAHRCSSSRANTCRGQERTSPSHGVAELPGRGSDIALRFDGGTLLRSQAAVACSRALPSMIGLRAAWTLPERARSLDHRGRPADPGSSDSRWLSARGFRHCQGVGGDGGSRTSSNPRSMSDAPSAFNELRVVQPVDPRSSPLVVAGVTRRDVATMITPAPSSVSPIKAATLVSSLPVRGRTPPLGAIVVVPGNVRRWLLSFHQVSWSARGLSSARGLLCRRRGRSSARMSWVRMSSVRLSSVFVVCCVTVIVNVSGVARRAVGVGGRGGDGERPGTGVGVGHRWVGRSAERSTGCAVAPSTVNSNVPAMSAGDGSLAPTLSVTGTPTTAVDGPVIVAVGAALAIVMSVVI